MGTVKREAYHHRLDGVEPEIRAKFSYECVSLCHVQTNSDAHLVWMRMGEARSMESTKISGSSSHAYTGVTCQYTDAYK